MEKFKNILKLISKRNLCMTVLGINIFGNYQNELLKTTRLRNPHMLKLSLRNYSLKFLVTFIKWSE